MHVYMGKKLKLKIQDTNLYTNFIKIISMVMNGIIQEQVKYKNEWNKWVGKSFLKWNYYQNKRSTQKCVIYKHERSWTIWLSVLETICNLKKDVQKIIW
jgi:hypothetical protein